ncbi:unnamed protein product [Cylicostephanus goldi]|uniref:C-type lectin domain-containing protein n=1 Tax=Cylicostephanus goldi TaxID=71465 RepID=A0A3P6S2S5_CYLGO|nr:unnamed protein product [Cylicostephanus goldi]
MVFPTNFSTSETAISFSDEEIFVATLSMSGNTYTDSSDLTWIGLKQLNYPSSKDWTWTDGTKVDYLAWAPTQPDNAGGVEHCVQCLYFQLYTCGTKMRAFVCKKKSIH